MDDLHLAYAVTGLLAVMLILLSHRLDPLPLTEPMVALAAGAVLGAPWLEVLTVPDDARASLLLESSRGLLAVSLVAVALRFPIRQLGPIVRPAAALVVLGMPLVAASAGGLIVLLFGWEWGLALLAGAALCPTDPILASGVVTGPGAEKTLPERPRQLITTESGANDGLALTLVAVAVAVVLGDGLGPALARTGYEVVAGLAIGAATGWVVGRAARALEERDEVERTPELMLTLFLAVAALGAARVANADGIVAAFVAGLAYNLAVPDRERVDQERLDEAFNRYLAVPVFVALGAVLPVQGWIDLGWPAAAFGLGVLVLRRLPAVLLLRPLTGLRLADSVLIGWFGPMGVSALFYLSHAEHEGVTDHRLFVVGTLAVAVSTVVHGSTEVVGRRLYARAVAEHGDARAAPSG